MSAHKGIELGFEVDTGKPYHVQIHHTCVTGMTDLSGKTTTVEAKLRRGNRKTLVFLTKRGEKTFLDADRIAPFYRERFDWEYVRSILESAMKERLKFETPWIIKMCRKAQGMLRGKAVGPGEGLKVVRQLIDEALENRKLREFDRNIYTLLGAYLDKVLPTFEAAKQKFTDKLELQQGLNVMDLTEWYSKEEVQMLVIRACMEYILAHENNVDVTLPEAWKMLPQFRNTPVKLFFEKFIREGATNGNFLTIDAQDLGGVDKTTLRQVSIWIMGKMMEANEVERLLKQTMGLKTKAEEIQTLKLGHFIVANGITNKVTKIYVWPWGVPKETAIEVAKGKISPLKVKEFLLEKRAKLLSEKGDDEEVYKAKYEEEHQKNKWLNKTVGDLKEKLEKTENRDKLQEAKVISLKRRLDRAEKDLKLYDEFRSVLRRMGFSEGKHPFIPPLPCSSLAVEHKGITATIKHVGDKAVTLSTDNQKGQVMYVLLNDFLPGQVRLADAKGVSEQQISEALLEHGWRIAHSSLAPTLGNLVKDGFLMKLKTKPLRYRLPLKVTVKVEGEAHA